MSLGSNSSDTGAWGKAFDFLQPRVPQSLSHLQVDALQIKHPNFPPTSDTAVII